jgi:hypothetical protein
VKRIGVCCLFVGWFANASFGFASEEEARGKRIVECIEAAAKAHKLPSGIIFILLDVEGGRLGKVSENKNQTVDIGPMQINEIWLDVLAKRWGASREETYVALRDEFCANVEGGAWILRQALDQAGGDFWEGVGLYHSRNELHKSNYLRKVFERALALQKTTEGDARAEIQASLEAGARR